MLLFFLYIKKCVLSFCTHCTSNTTVPKRHSESGGERRDFVRLNNTEVEETKCFKQCGQLCVQSAKMFYEAACGGEPAAKTDCGALLSLRSIPASPLKF